MTLGTERNNITWVRRVCIQYVLEVLFFYVFKINVSDCGSPEQLIQQLITPAEQQTEHSIHYVVFCLFLLRFFFIRPVVLDRNQTAPD